MQSSNSFVWVHVGQCRQTVIFLNNRDNAGQLSIGLRESDCFRTKTLHIAFAHILFQWYWNWLIKYEKASHMCICTHFLFEWYWFCIVMNVVSVHGWPVTLGKKRAISQALKIHHLFAYIWSYWLMADNIMDLMTQNLLSNLAFCGVAWHWGFDNMWEIYWHIKSLHISFDQAISPQFHITLEEHYFLHSIVVLCNHSRHGTVSYWGNCAQSKLLIIDCMSWYKCTFWLYDDHITVSTPDTM